MDFLQVYDGKIVDARQQPVFLRGVNIGGWMNMEHFLTGHSGSESNLRRVMRQELGAERAEFFFDRLMFHFFNQEDVRFLKRNGVTAIRLPVNYRCFESDLAPFEYAESGFQRLDSALEWCESQGIYVILDLHSVQGWQNGDWHCDNSSRHALFWSQRQAQDRFVALWQEIARRYRHRAVIAAFNLVNEPLSNAPYGRFVSEDDYQPDWEAINRIYRRTVQAIREIDSEHIIALEGDHYSTLFSELDEPFDANLLYSNHNYIEPAVTPIDAYPVELGGVYWDFQEVRRQFEETEGYGFAKSYSVPLLVGEFGVSMNYPDANAIHKVNVFRDQIRVYDDLGCHWTFWSYKALGTMGWVQTRPDSPYKRTIEPVLRAKERLGVDFGWLAGFSPAVQVHVNALNEEIVACIPGVDSRTNLRYLSQAAMSTYTADQLQTLYARQFSTMSEEEIDAVLTSFSLSNCLERKEMSQAIRSATVRSFGRKAGNGS
jgi:endoglucanase